jgi:hypothetical protein
MHREKPVMEMELDNATGTISKLGDVHDAAHLPVGTRVIKGIIDRSYFNQWWQGRAIPAQRSGLRDALEALQTPTPLLLLTKCFGLSLSDQYWVRSNDAPVEWEKINFFDNSFSSDVGDALFGAPIKGKINLMSPNNASDGWLKKKWVISDDKRILIKGGSGRLQEPINEAIASSVCERLGIPHVPYTVAYDGNKPLSLCEDFVTRDTDLVSAFHINETMKRSNNMSNYQHFIKCCEALGIPGAVESIDKMLVLDFLIRNEDRHFNNFGAIRNAQTLEWVGISPIFDNGTSLWYNTPSREIRPYGDADSKPFRKVHSEQIKLVRDFSWINMSTLKGVAEEFYDLLKQSDVYIDDTQREALCRGLAMRLNLLEDIVIGHDPKYPDSMRLNAEGTTFQLMSQLRESAPSIDKKKQLPPNNNVTTRNY